MLFSAVLALVAIVNPGFVAATRRQSAASPQKSPATTVSAVGQSS